MHSRSAQNQNESIFIKDLQKTNCKLELQKKINKLRSSGKCSVQGRFKILKFKSEILRQVILCCAQENFLEKWENIEQVGVVYISIIIKIITRSAEVFLPATSPSVPSAGRVIIFKLLHNLRQMTSDKAFQTVMVTQSSP